MKLGLWLCILAVAVGALWWLVRAGPTQAVVAPTKASPIAEFKPPPNALAAAPTVARLIRLGEGRSTGIAFDAQATKVAVATTVGVYLYDAATLTRLAFHETDAPVQTVTFSPDGAEIAFSTSGPHAQLYRWRQVDNGITTQALDKPLINGLAFSPDGVYLVGMSFDHLLIWNAANRKLLLTHEQPGALQRNIAFAPDGQFLVVLARDSLELWRLGENRLLQTITPPPGRYFSTETVAFSPTGDQIAVAGLREPVLYIWRVTDQDGLTTLTQPRVGDDTAFIEHFQFAPDGTQIALGLSNGALLIHSLTAPSTTTVTLPLAASVNRVAWSADGAFVGAGVADGSVHIWASAQMTVDQVITLPPSTPAAPLRNLHIAPDNYRHLLGQSANRYRHLLGQSANRYRHLLGQSANRGSVTVELASGALYQWQLADGKLIASLEQHSLGPIHSVAFTPDSSQVVIGAKGGVVQFWAWAQGLPVSTYRTPVGQVDAVALSPDGAWLAAALSRPLALGVWADPIQLLHTTVRAGAQPVWQFADKSAVTTLDTDDTGFVTTCGIFWNSVVFSQDDQYIATSSFAHKALLWRRQDGVLLHTLEGHTSAILDLALSPDSTLLATASDDGDVRVWQTSDGGMRYRLPDHAGGAVAVAFSPDGRWLATRAALGDVRLWYMNDGESLLSLTDVKNPRSNLAFSPDGAFLASGTTENSALLWSVADSTQVYVLQGHNEPVNGVAFAPDGAHLATAADDGTVMIWALPPVITER